MMTAAEVDYVFNLKECSVEGYEAAAFATAGLSNHVIAGEDLVDYEENSRISARRAEEMRAGTINIGIISSVPMTIEGKINLFIPLVEAKGVAMSEHGFAETGTPWPCSPRRGRTGSPGRGPGHGSASPPPERYPQRSDAL